MDARDQHVISGFVPWLLCRGSRQMVENYCRKRKKRIAKRKVIVLQMLFTAISALTIERDVWMRRRSQEWWDTYVPWFGDTEFIENFRMTRDTFDFICQRLSSRLSRKKTRLRSPVSVEKRVGLSLYWLATGAGYRTMANLFGLSKATVCLTVRDFCMAVKSVLMTEFIRVPQGNDLDVIVRGFKTKWGFPQCAGAIDGTHIPIIAPEEDPSEYYNRKGWHSVVLQGVVDHQYRFTNIYGGWPGRVHDARVLKNSSIYGMAERGELFPPDTEEINGVQIPLTLLGDPAYPLLPWLMKGYTENGNLTVQQRNFNQRLSRARMTVECAFGRLKGRWRCLGKRLDVDISGVPNIISACCTLHNICEMRGEAYDDDTSSADNDGDASSASDDPQDIAEPLRIREVLTDYFSHSRERL